jgi:hypothetical protein
MLIKFSDFQHNYSEKHICLIVVWNYQTLILKGMTSFPSLKLLCSIKERNNVSPLKIFLNDYSRNVCTHIMSTVCIIDNHKTFKW